MILRTGVTCRPSSAHLLLRKWLEPFSQESAGTKIGLQVNGDVSDISEPEIGIKPTGAGSH
ncbi:MAG: hypothetical protein E6K39_16080 [Gammaproteobacteria bacterium]|nr:MAG: hypothetical protein E6K39_16080 [Gammaproteobacteria bacterium]